MTRRHDLPLTVLAGYLGAGKTTLLRRVLTASHGHRVGVLVNDFGAVGLDASLLESTAAETVELVNGCVCCTLADDLGRGLDTLLAVEPRLDQVILEASGVSDPGRLAALARTWPGYRFDGTFVCVDVTRIHALVTDRFIGTTVLRQLAAADVIILTHLDECPDPTSVRDWLKRRAPQARQVRGDDDPRLLLVPANLPAGRPPTRGSPQPDSAGHAPGASLRTWSECIEGPIERSRIAALMHAHPELLRAKGEVWLAEDPVRRYILQRVGERWEVVDSGPWGERPPTTRIDCIATA